MTPGLRFPPALLRVPREIRAARWRVAGAGASIVQTPVAAGLAWYIAHTLLGHHQPFFAPTAAAVSLSKSTMLRGQHALQLIGGAVLGIGVGAGVKTVAGSAPDRYGALAIAAAVAIALVAALAVGGGFFGHGVLFVNQSTTSAILMIAVAGAATGSERLSDALIGGGVTLVITVILFPAAPLPLIQDAVRHVFTALRDTAGHLARLAGQGQRADPDWALAAAQHVQGELARLQEAESAARQVASLAPRRWPDRSAVRRAGERAARLHLVAAAMLSLAQASTTGSAQQPYGPAVCEALGELTSAFAALAEGGEVSVAAAARHTSRIPALLMTAEQAGDPHAQLMARLVVSCAEDTLRFARETAGPVP